MRKVAVTGQIASGKSSFCRFLEECGAFVMSADQVVRQLLSPRSPIGKKVIELLGAEIVAGESLDRAIIAQKVFNNPSLLRKLEELLHPEVLKQMNQTYEQVVRDRLSYPLFVCEVPLLFESGMERCFDVVIVVISEQVRLPNSMTEQEYLQRQKRFLPTKEVVERADFVISNQGTMGDLKREAQKTFNFLTSL
ncbi:MAG: dephospho-CoA kinase [Chlamydiales bacterium]